MPFLKVGTRLLNLDAVTSIETAVRAQHPQPTGGRVFVDDAVRLGFGGTAEPVLLFDDEAENVRTYFARTGAPVIDIAEPGRAPAPLTKAPVAGTTTK